MAKKAKSGKSGSVANILADKGYEFAHVGLFDLNGGFRERRIRVSDLDSVIGENGTFVNVLPQWDVGEAVAGSGPFVGEAVSLDPNSIRPYPFEESAAIVVAEYAGPSEELSPRSVLQQQIDRADSLGVTVKAAFEFEFHVLDQDADEIRANGFDQLGPFASDNRCWAGESAAIYSEFVADLGETLLAGNIDPVALGLELGPGCLETTLRATDPMRAADDAAFFKMMTKAFARRQGRTACFMAQMGHDFAGLSGHLHLSFHDKKTGKALFPDQQGEHGMSAMFQSAVAGMVALAPDGFALSHHTVNAYRRHSPGNWAPKTSSWAPENYSVGVRVVAAPEERCRFEYRLPGSDTNPFLTLSFAIAACLWGIETNASLPAPFLDGGPDAGAEGGEPLPRTLAEAAERLQANEPLRTALGDRFIDHFSHICLHEDGAMRRHVSAAERKRYMEAV